MTPSSDHNNPNGGNPPSSPSPPTSSPSPSQQGDLAQIEAYLNWWFGPALSDPQLSGMQIVLAAIRRPKKDKMHFAAFDNVAAAAQWAVAASMLSNVYYHAAIHGPRPNGKGSIDTALCLPGLLADLDAQSPFRSENEGKPPTLEALYLLVRDFEKHYPFQLNLVESGHGIYPQVRFKEPLFLVDQKTRDEAGELLSRFAEAFRIFGRQRGWPHTVDRVTLAGLVRLPGTWNRKGSSPLPVRLIDRAAGAQ
jgi:hypothetical protein